MGPAAPPSATPRARSSTAALVTERIRDGSRDRFVRAGDFSGSPAAIERTLGRLVARGELVRVRNGLYYRGADTPLGMAHPDPLDIIAELAPGRVFGPAAVTAANALGLTTQVARRPMFAVTGWDGRPLERARILRRGGVRGRGREAAELREIEVAVLEVLDAWTDVVELPAEAAVRRLTNVLRSGEVRRGALVVAGRTEPARVRERLRFLLGQDAGGADHDIASIPVASRASITEHALVMFGTSGTPHHGRP